MNCVETFPDGSHIVGGGVSGTIYIWNVSSGLLVRYWPAHYKCVTCIKFTDCGSFIITGGEDAIIHIWNIFDVIDSTSR